MHFNRNNKNFTLLKIKKCGYRSNRTKNANSDSRETNLCEMGRKRSHLYIQPKFAFLSNSLL